MVLSVVDNKKKYKAIEVDIQFPFYRYLTEHKEHAAYCKFESVGKFSMIEEEYTSTTIRTYDDPNKDLLKDVASEDLLKGQGQWAVIDEKLFDSAYARLVDKIGKI